MARADTNGAGARASTGTADPDVEDASALALRALVWTLADPRLAMRLLDVTGLDPRDLKARAGEPAVLAATLAFLESHEPNLVACAAQLGHPPAALVAARAMLEGGAAAEPA